MTIKKSKTRQVFESLRGGPLGFGRMLESIRTCDDISQTDLAKKLKISRAHLCDIEKGRRFVTAEKAAKFAKVLGYSINQFVACVLEEQLRRMGLKLKVEVQDFRDGQTA